LGRAFVFAKADAVVAAGGIVVRGPWASAHATKQDLDDEQTMFADLTANVSKAIAAERNHILAHREFGTLQIMNTRMQDFMAIAAESRGCSSTDADA
jgi:hypothetical protein